MHATVTVPPQKQPVTDPVDGETESKAQYDLKEYRNIAMQMIP